MDFEQKRHDPIYVAIDLKSFYASVECSDRGLDPLGVNLVVADPTRTEKTICLAVSPSLKAWGVSGRARLFEVVQRISQVNSARKNKAYGHKLTGESYVDKEIKENPSLAVSYIVAPPRMHRYMEVSNQIYDIYLKYVAPEDMHVYSVDEVFLDVTNYLNTYKMTAHELALTIIRDVLKQTGITATAGIGTNLYLCKIAMDVVAKKMPADEDGVRIAELDEMTFRRELWNHKPITDFWRTGPGIAKRLAQNGMYTMGDVARCSIGGPNEFYNEDLLYKILGVNAELLIDHAWGWEPCRISDIKAYKPENNSLSTGQVLSSPYDYEKTRLVIKEMTELLTLDLVEKKVVTDQMGLYIGYDIDNLLDPARREKYKGEVVTDHYGRQVPKGANSTINLKMPTSSTKLIMEAVMELFDRIVDPNLLTRRMSVVANHVVRESSVKKTKDFEQLDLFTDYSKLEKERAREEEELAKEKRAQEAVISIKNRFGKNAILKGMNLCEGGTSIERNGQIGGHKA